MKKNKFIYILLICLLLGDYAWSFIQYYNTMLDGDMAGGIVTDKNVCKILNDPFGIQVIFKNEPHANPNRFFTYLLFRDYFRSVPSFLQLFVSPVESVYLACALIKILTHVLIVYFLSAIITKTKSILKTRLLFVSVLITPLFQTYGFNNDMGIIDISITYFFFYALPIMLLLFFLYLFYDLVFKINEKGSIIIKILLVILSVILPFCGALIPPIIVLLAGLLFVYYLFSYFQRNQPRNINRTIGDFFRFIPNDVKLIYIPITLLSLYSVYLGTYDTQYKTVLIQVSERYLKLLTGFYDIFISKSGFHYLMLLITVNCIVIRLAFYNTEGKKILKSLMWIIVFSIIYLSLLPLGGYRPYRPNIIRYDTIIPITLFLFYIYSYSSYYLVKHLKARKIQIVYFIILVFIIYSYTEKDKNIKFDNNCEKEALITISESNEKIVSLKNNCQIMSWEVITDYKQSEMNGELIKLLGITNEKKMYYSEHPVDNKK